MSDSDVEGPQRDDNVAFRCLMLSVFGSGFSLPLGRSMLAVSLLLLLWTWCRSRRVPAMPPVAKLAGVFVLIAMVATVCGVDPARGIHKLPKLLWFAGIPVVAVLASSAARVRGLVAAYACGAGVLAVRTCIGHPFAAWRLVEAGTFPTFNAALVDMGSMTSAQRLMVGMVFTLGLLLATPAAERRARLRWVGLLALLIVGLVINFKRGAWISTLAISVLFLAVRTSWKPVVVVLLGVLLLLLVPAVRDRLGDLRDEFGARGGGRMLMWTRIAPQLVSEHPWLGIGFRALTNDRMREIAPTVEPDRNHLHSNPIQMLVDTGVIGLIAYLVWMGRSLYDGWRAWRQSRGDPAGAAVALSLLVGLLGLLLNGLVEYNFGDAEIVLAYGLIMGACATYAPREICEPLARNSTSKSVRSSAVGV